MFDDISDFFNLQAELQKAKKAKGIKGKAKVFDKLDVHDGAWP